MEEVEEIRCIRCNKLLGTVPKGTKLEKGINIKCTKCKLLHNYKLGKYV